MVFSKSLNESEFQADGCIACTAPKGTENTIYYGCGGGPLFSIKLHYTYLSNHYKLAFSWLLMFPQQHQQTYKKAPSLYRAASQSVRDVP